MVKTPKRKKRTELNDVGYGKTIASVLGGAVTTIAAYFVEQWLGHPLPEVVSGAVQTVITAAAVFFTHHTLFEKVDIRLHRG
jgi:L-lactate permease